MYQHLAELVLFPTPACVMVSTLMCPQLLSKPKFSGVEKIKTIGSTYMAATGLNVTPGPECTQASFFSCTQFHVFHIYLHMDISHELQKEKLQSRRLSAVAFQL